MYKYIHTGMLNIYLTIRFNFINCKLKHFLDVLRTITEVAFECTQCTEHSTYDGVSILRKQQTRQVYQGISWTYGGKTVPCHENLVLITLIIMH